MTVLAAEIGRAQGLPDSQPSRNRKLQVQWERWGPREENIQNHSLPCTSVHIYMHHTGRKLKLKNERKNFLAITIPVLERFSVVLSKRIFQLFYVAFTVFFIWLFYMTETIHKFLFPSFTVIKHSGQMQLGEERVCLFGLHFQVILCYWRAGTHSGNLEAGTVGEHCLLAHSLTCSQVHA